MKTGSSNRPPHWSLKDVNAYNLRNAINQKLDINSCTTNLIHKLYRYSCIIQFNEIHAEANVNPLQFKNVVYNGNITIHFMKITLHESIINVPQINQSAC